MTYDKDIRVCMISMTVIGVLMVVGLVINLIMRNWVIAASYTLWIWAGGVMVRNAESHQKTRDETRAGMAELIRAWSNVKPASLNENSDLDKAYGYRSYTCPKCGKVSHHPEDLKHRYCAWCHEFEHLERRV